ncbi:M20/M25/M40 family metallo-hydrolase [bacterium]|nr:M20/M25/M40 family metallo-hydrolase [bacterium]
MKRNIVFILALFLIVSPALTKDGEIEFDAQSAWGYIKDLAADSMLGRESGQPGGVMGEEYIASKFREWRLEPAGEKGTFFQKFTIEHRHVEEGVTMEIDTPQERREFYYGEDWRVQRYSGTGHFTAEIVFVGYGIHAPEKGYDDYADVDVQGKVVLLGSGIPQKMESKLGKKAEMSKRIETAQKQGARGVVVFQSSSDRSRYFRVRVKKEIYDPDFVILSAKENVVDFIFKNLKTETRQLFRKIREENKTVSFKTGEKAYISVDAIFDEKRPTRNVLAKITGTDPELKDEYVIIGGHMDHLGVTPLGDIMNGANDNASGTAVAMEIARIMKLNDAQPKRTVIFALWAAEEQGLLGSRHYAENPLFPLDKTVAYINMDMVGHGTGKVPFMGVYYGPQIWEVLQKKVPEDILSYVKPERGGPGGSDHTPFLMEGVPGYFIITEGAIKYHHPRDDSDLINPDMLKKTGDFVHHAVKILANEEGNFFPPMRQETFYLKYQQLINHKLSPLEGVIAGHKDVESPCVDLQLSYIEEPEGLSGDELRVELIKKFLSGLKKIKKAKGLSYYKDNRTLSSTSRKGQTTVLTGIRGLHSLKNYPQWGKVMAEQGIKFALGEDPSFLFNGNALSEEGKKTFETLNTSGLLLAFQNLDEEKARILLENAQKPILLLQSEVPSQDILKLIKKKQSALGFILSQDKKPSSYFKKLEKAKEVLETDHLMMVNEYCLWKKEGKDHMKKVISHMVEADYERSEMRDLFSSTFLNLLQKLESEENSSSPFRHPF